MSRQLARYPFVILSETRAQNLLRRPEKPGKVAAVKRRFGFAQGDASQSKEIRNFQEDVWLCCFTALKPKAIVKPLPIQAWQVSRPAQLRVAGLVQIAPHS